MPWPALADSGLLLLAIVAGTAALVLPRVAADRREAQRREQRAEAQRHAEFLASVDRIQRARKGAGRQDPGPGVPATRRRAARTALLASAEADIELAARRGGRERLRGVDCEPFPGSPGAVAPVADLARRAAAYNCVAVTARFGRRSLPGGRGIIGDPFRLVVDFTGGRFAFCRVVPLGERDRLTHPLPDACRLPARR